MNTRTHFFSVSACLLLFALSTPVWAAQPRAYEVTVTNITPGQILSPAVVVLHHERMEPLFVLGEPASDGLAAVAEDALIPQLVSEVMNRPYAFDVQVLASTETPGPIPPGQSASVVVESQWHGPGLRLSLAGMLVTTNDAFYGLRNGDVPLPRSFRGRDMVEMYVVPAYDAGSEANTELCEHIPGPPCGNAGVRVTEGAEGFVHIHSGVHGGSDLDPSVHDWRNPVAKITIRALR